MIGADESVHLDRSRGYQSEMMREGGREVEGEVKDGASVVYIQWIQCLRFVYKIFDRRLSMLLQELTHEIVETAKGFEIAKTIITI